MFSDFNDFECNDFEKLLFADPGSTGTCKLIIAYHPGFPLALGRIECASGLPIDVRVNVLESTPVLHTAELVFTGKTTDLCELQMRLTQWAAQFPHLPPMPEEALYARDNPSAPSGPPKGVDQSGV
jgi:hypothetical protein